MDYFKAAFGLSNIKFSRGAESPPKLEEQHNKLLRQNIPWLNLILHFRSPATVRGAEGGLSSKRKILLTPLSLTIYSSSGTTYNTGPIWGAAERDNDRAGGGGRRHDPAMQSCWG